MFTFKEPEHAQHFTDYIDAILEPWIGSAPDYESMYIELLTAGPSYQSNFIRFVENETADHYNAMYPDQPEPTGTSSDWKTAAMYDAGMNPSDFS